MFRGLRLLFAENCECIHKKRSIEVIDLSDPGKIKKNNPIIIGVVCAICGMLIKSCTCFTDRLLERVADDTYDYLKDRDKK